MKWKKLGHIFNPTLVNDGIERAWMKAYSQCVSTVIHNDFVRVYFSCRPHADEQGQYVSHTAFIDLDRADLTKVVNIAKTPILPLGELGTFDEFAVYPTCVIQTEDRYRLYYAGWTRCKSTPYTVSIGMAESTDGEYFHRYSKGPILTNSPLEPFELSGPKVRKIGDKWFMYYLAGEGWVMDNGKPVSIYKIRLATSTDGIQWEKLNKNIINSILPEEECQAGPDVFFKDGRYHMYFSYRYACNFKNKERGYKIGYAYSENGIDWTRDDSQAGIALSETGWDSEMHHYPHIMLLDGNYYMLYNGNEFGKYGFGLAILTQ